MAGLDSGRNGSSCGKVGDSLMEAAPCASERLASVQEIANSLHFLGLGCRFRQAV